MSTIKNNPLLKGASGMLGDVVVFREVRGKLVMSNRPKKSGVLTEQQRAVRERFLAAVQYSKTQMADPDSKAWYAARMGSRYLSPYEAAVSDYLKVPVVHNIDVALYTGAVGSIIEVQASDDFQIVSVTVLISTSAGVVLESGEATAKAGNLTWSYAAKVINAAPAGSIIRVSVNDRPGNTTTKEIVVA